MTGAHQQWFFGGDEVHDQERSESQVRGLLKWLGQAPKRVVDFGCGVGRTVVPLSAAGHEVLGIDCDSSVVESCRAMVRSQDLKAEVICSDFRQTPLALPNQADAMLCLGNTFMLLVDPLEAVELLSQWRQHLAPGGAVILDDIPQDLLGELTEGRWLEGISEDGHLQLAWAHGDLVFAVRSGAAINQAQESLQPGEPCFRLWTMGGLELLASQAGLCPPQWLPEAGLLVLENA